MRNISFIIALLMSLLIFQGFQYKNKTAVVGRVNPAEAAEIVWLLGEKDSLRTGVSEGQFFFDVKPGVYKLLVDAREPYKDALIENLVVKQDETHDVGEIILKQ